MKPFDKKILWGLGLTGAGCALAVAALLALPLAHPRASGNVAAGADPDSEDGGDGALPVKVVRAKYDPSFVLSVEEPAQVMPYYLAELDAQVAGRVEFIRKAEGAPVKAGELLAKLAAPDLEQEVALKAATVEQRRRELDIAQTTIRIAQAAVESARSAEEIKKAEVDVAESTRVFREKELRRLRRLIDGTGTTQEVVDEHEQYYAAAVAEVARARNAVLKARSDLVESLAKFDAALADINLKKALIAVAEKDRDKARALADYAQIQSSFDGRVKRRHQDPGSFVRVGEPILTVERTDIVTVTMKVPDTFAPYVSENTEAEIEMSEFPGQTIRGKVTRFSPSLQTKDNDHTMLVEVDLFNGSHEDFDRFAAAERAKKVPFEDLKEGPLPLVPDVVLRRPTSRPTHLLPGMYGEMRLVFDKLPDTLLVPSGAIVREGGTPHLYLVKDGHVHRVPVEVQVDDQRLAKVVTVDRVGNREILRDLTGNEQIVYSNLGELSEGQAVRPLPVDWNPHD